MHMQSNIRGAAVRLPCRTQQPLHVVQAPLCQPQLAASSRTGTVWNIYVQYGTNGKQQQRSGAPSQQLHAVKRGSNTFPADEPDELDDQTDPLLDYDDELEEDDLEELANPVLKQQLQLLPGMNVDDDTEDEPADEEWLESQGMDLTLYQARACSCSIGKKML